MIRVYNTMARRKEPLEAKRVRMYVCGITAYDECHLGHARSAVAFDVMVRYLRWRGHEVVYVRNYTDLDDKIIARARREGRSWRAIAEHYIRQYEEQMELLGVEPPTHAPRATQHLPEMIELIQRLQQLGFAYERDGDVFFRVRSFPGYGKLSGKSLEELRAGARVEVDPRKEDPLDFALWKRAKEGEPCWDSPWGRGRPGWHIECSAMSLKYLGESFEVHGGGADLIFPHHENEIAQSEAATGKPFARWWVHNGFVNFRGQKMSKSLGNLITISEALERYHPEAIRLCLLSRHYRSPLDLSEEVLAEAQAALDRLYRLFERLGEGEEAPGPPAGPLGEALRRAEAGFQRAMEDDFNSAGALGHLQALARRLGQAVSGGAPPGPVRAAAGRLREMLGVLGLVRLDPREYFSQRRHLALQRAGLSEEELQRLIAERHRARLERDWERADRIRAELAQRGIVLEDTPHGTTWRGS